MSTPTKAAEIIREALAKARTHVNSDRMEAIIRDRYSWTDVADDAINSIDRALSLLADLDGGGEVVAWMREDCDDSCDAFIFHSPTELPNPFFPIPLYRHSSPTAADAPPEAEIRKPVDVAEVIKAGDAMYDEMAAPFAPEGKVSLKRSLELSKAWRSATKAFRP